LPVFYKIPQIPGRVKGDNGKVTKLGETSLSEKAKYKKNIPNTFSLLTAGQKRRYDKPINQRGRRVVLPSHGKGNRR